MSRLILQVPGGQPRRWRLRLLHLVPGPAVPLPHHRAKVATMMGLIHSMISSLVLGMIDPETRWTK